MFTHKYYYVGMHSYKRKATHLRKTMKINNNEYNDDNRHYY